MSALSDRLRQLALIAECDSDEAGFKDAASALDAMESALRNLMHATSGPLHEQIEALTVAGAALAKLEGK